MRANLHLATMSTPTEHKEHQKRKKMQKSETKRIVDTTAFPPNPNIPLAINFARLPKLSRIWTMAHTWFFCCTLLACHEGRGRSPSVSGIGEKTDFLTFQLNCKNIQQIKQQCKQTINAEVELGQRPRTCGYSRLMAPYPSVARVSWGFRDTTDGECIGTGTQRNRRSDRIRVVEPQMTKWVRWNNPAKAYYRVPVSWRAQAT